MLTIDYKDRRPIHKQISDGMKELIIKGLLKADEKMPSVRELSVSLDVNPNTVQKAYKELESENYIYSVQGKGNFVSGNIPKESKKTNELIGTVRSCCEELKFLNVKYEEILNEIKKVYEKE